MAFYKSHWNLVWVLTAIVCLVAACGTGIGQDRNMGNPVKASDDGVLYPRNFRASAELISIATGRTVATASYDGANPAAVFGCSETSDGGEFVFFLRNADEALKIDIQKAYFRESKSIYSNLIDVTLTGTLMGAAFDRNRQQYQLQSCRTEFHRRAHEAYGSFTCDDVVPIASNNQHRLDIRFSCSIVSRS